jgi:predicted ABC-type ATPase
VFGVDAFNIDDRRAALTGSYVGITSMLRTRVGSECEAFIAAHIAARRSFTVESTLRTLRAVEQAREARAVGLDTVMYFLCASSPDVALQRVRARASGGGHGAREDIVRTTYFASVENRWHAIEAFEVVRCFDTTRHGEPPVQSAVARDGVRTVLDAATSASAAGAAALGLIAVGLGAQRRDVKREHLALLGWRAWLWP